MMKQIVLEIPELARVKHINDVSKDKYYVFTAKDDLGFIERETWDSGRFRCRSTDKLTNGNCYGFSGETLEQTIRQLIDAGFTVYEFDTAYEMFGFMYGKLAPNNLGSHA